MRAARHPRDSINVSNIQNLLVKEKKCAGQNKCSCNKYPSSDLQAATILAKLHYESGSKWNLKTLGQNRTKEIIQTRSAVLYLIILLTCKQETACQTWKILKQKSRVQKSINTSIGTFKLLIVNNACHGKKLAEGTYRIQEMSREAW